MFESERVVVAGNHQLDFQHSHLDLTALTPKHGETAETQTLSVVLQKLSSTTTTTKKKPHKKPSEAERPDLTLQRDAALNECLTNKFQRRNLINFKDKEQIFWPGN